MFGCNTDLQIALQDDTTSESPDELLIRQAKELFAVSRVDLITLPECDLQA